LVTLGIRPTYPATGYGYIQQGDLITESAGLNVYQALQFREKPDEVSARKMISGNDHSWNSGMFVWRADRILQEIASQMPDLNAQLEQISKAWNQSNSQTVLDQVWPEIQPQTIDYGIMENAHNVAVIPADGLGWNDVGSWEALFDVLPSDADGNILQGAGHLPHETNHTLIFSKQPGRTIVTIGVEDLVIVDTGDVVLVCQKDQTQKVRQVVEYLKSNRTELL
jgi:mannose-1-phosphate guanylyltransferase